MLGQNRQGIFPLTRNQREIYFEQLLHPDTCIFNIGGPITIDGPLQPGILVKAVRNIYKIHPEPNTTIFEEDGFPLQRIGSRDDFPHPIIDLSDLPNPEREAHLYIDRHFQEPLSFGLESPLCSMALFIINPHRHIWYSKFHHIICDAWTLPLLHRKIVEEYNRLLKGEPGLHLEEFRFEKFIVADQQYAASESFQKDRQYWEKKLVITPHSHYPLKKPFAYKSGHETFILPRKKFEQMIELARQENCSSFHFIIAILFSYLAQAHQTYDLSVALPILNRRTRAFKETPGLFVNVLPLRMRIDPNWSFRVLLKEIALQLAQDYRHGRFAVGHLLRKREAASKRPQHLVELSFSYERLVYDYDFDGCRNKVIPLTVHQQVRPLQIYLREYSQREDVVLSFDYNLSFIDQSQMQDMVSQFEELTDQALRNPDAAICTPKYLAAEEQRHLASDAFLPAAIDLVSMFQQQAAVHSERIAVKYKDEQLSYFQLNARANQLARLLRSRGLASEDLVGICLDRCADTILAILAILKAGASYLPVDPAYPPQRISYLLHDSRPRLLITDSRYADSIDPGQCPLLVLDRQAELIDSFTGEDLGLEIDPDQCAYIIYTSGSTGQPKGCMVTHSNVTRLMRAGQEEFRFNEEDVWTMFHSYAFDFSVWEMWGALLSGGRLVVVDYWTSREPEKFYEMVKREAVTVLNQTPTAFRQMMWAEEQQEEGRKGEEQRQELGLRLVIFGGEALDLGSLQGWFSRHEEGKPKLVNMYGITETTVHVTRREIRRHEARKGTGSLIGGGMAGVRVYLLDEEMREVGEGKKGEIYVGGTGVARGYWGRADLTAERFVPDERGEQGGERMYRSGDEGRRRAGGEMEYVGRKDEQVKVRGYRIELGEIEAVVKEYEGIREAVSVAVEGEGGEKRLVCYVREREGGERVRVEELRRHMEERMPDYMVPGRIVKVERMPVNENGKVDRKELIRWWREREDEGVEEEGRRDEGGRNGVGMDEVEEKMKEVWKEVLGLNVAGIDDNFFERGGDSILALQLAAKTRKHGLEITFKDIYERPTLRTLMMQCVNRSTNRPVSDSSLTPAGEGETNFARLPADVEDAFPLSSLQAGMLYHSERDPQSAIFHDIFSIQIQAAWRERSWRNALDELAQAHAALRTSFDLGRYSEAMQIVHSAVTIPYDVTDLRRHPEEDQRQEINLWIEREKGRSFSFERAPLLRMHVHLLGEDRFQLTISFHHAVLDGWSAATLITQLLLSYTGARKVKAVSRSNDFRAFIYAEKDALADDDLRQFWIEQLSGMPVTRLANSHHSSAQGPIIRRRVAISKELNRSLIQLSQHCSVPLKTVLLAAHLQVLSRLSGQARAVTGYVTHSRPESDDVDTLGLFLNTLPFSAPVPDCSWIEFVQRVFLKEKELLSNRIYPLARIKQLNNEQLPFDVGFNYVQFHVYNSLLNVEGLKVLDFQVYEETDFPLLAQFTRHPWSLELDLTLIYDSQKFTALQIAQIADSYAEVLMRITTNPHAHTGSSASHENGEIIVQWPPDLNFSDVPYVPPANAIEEKLALLYEEVLNVRPIGTRHNFFEFGGNSILAARLVSRIRHVLQTDLALNVLFENPDIERLGKCISGAAHHSTAAAPAIRRVHRKLAKIKISNGE